MFEELYPFMAVKVLQSWHERPSDAACWEQYECACLFYAHGTACACIPAWAAQAQDW